MALFDSKATAGPSSPTASYNDDDFQRMDPSGVKRGLKTRHLSMMALAGIIGPGILVGTGGALAQGGPASLLIAFCVIDIPFSSNLDTAAPLLRNRAGTLAIVNMIPLFVMSSRNNPLIQHSLSGGGK